MSKALLQSDFDTLCGEFHDKVAVIYDVGERRSTLTYKNVDDISREIAQKIQFHAQPNIVIPCLCAPSAFVPALMIGILRAKCAFMFLDLGNPNFSSTPPLDVLAADKELFENVMDRSHWQVLDCVCDQSLILAKHVGSKDSIMAVNSMNHHGMDIAYVMQTSGTTGTPKTVKVPHQCILPNISHLRRLLTISSDDVILQAAPLTFDPCIVEVFSALGSGATLLMTSDRVKMMPRLVSSLCVANAVSIMQVTPSFFLRLGEPLVKNTLLSKGSALKALVLGGEPCPTSELLHKWREKGNTTEFFNIYGITEVSCWATCAHIDVDSKSSEPVPLGSPLEGTILEVRNENGNVINEGLGTLFIGGSQRRCLIDLETPECLDVCHMRDSGDIVCRSPGGALSYVGRRDRIVKYNGRKINPACLEEVLKRTLKLEDCYCHFARTRKQLLVFVLLRNGEEKEKMKSVDDVLKQECYCPYIVHHVPAFPMSRHGKVNYKALLRLAEKAQETNKVAGIKPKVLLQKLWEEATGRDVSASSNLIMSGGNSVDAVSISQEVELAAGCPLPRLLDILLNESFSSVATYLDSGDHHDDPLFRTTAPGKRKRETLLEERRNRVVKVASCFLCVSRFDRRRECACGSLCQFEVETRALTKMGISWKYDLLKCVDASPVLIHYEGGDTVTCIGSHYGKFSAIDTFGVAFWDTFLPDRIESSACVSRCGKYIAVGCYDYHIYCLRVDTGSLHWRHATGGEVKSSPTLNKRNNALLCGSHDKHIYCIDFETGNLSWKRRISEGSVFASSSVSYEPYCVYGATLDGYVAALCPTTGDALWCCCLAKPIFSSPLALARGVCVCCVGGTANLLDHRNGCTLWTTQLDGPIFSSPALLSGPAPFIILGCHDKCLYVVKEEDGSVAHSLNLDSPVYCTPFCVGKREQDCVVVTASTAGTVYVVDVHRGTKLASYTLPGEVFSSPIVYKNDIIVGCRDNNVYSIKYC